MRATEVDSFRGVFSPGNFYPAVEPQPTRKAEEIFDDVKPLTVHSSGHLLEPYFKYGDL